jgi:hypothetical protein
MSPDPVPVPAGAPPQAATTAPGGAGPEVVAPALADAKQLVRALELVSTPPSPPFSFKGWLFGTWLVKNKGAVKLLLVLFFAWLTVLFAVVQPPELKALLVGFVGFASKFGLDLLDYWLTPQPEAKPQ